MGKGTGNTTVKTIKSSYFCTGSDTIQNKQKKILTSIFLSHIIGCVHIICEMVVKGAYVCSVSESYYSYKPNMKRYHVTFSMCHCESVTQKKMLRPRVHEWYYFNTTTSILLNQVKIDVHRYSRSMKAKICLRTNYGNRTIKMVWTFTLTTHQKH